MRSKRHDVQLSVHPGIRIPACLCRFVPDMSSRTEYLEDSDLLAAKFVRRSGDAGSRTSDGDYLALEHPDTGPKRQQRVVRCRLPPDLS